MPNPFAVQPTPAPDISLPQPTMADLMSDATQSEVVVSAEVESLGEAPGRVATPCAYQGVTYRSLEVLQGALEAAEFRVAHPVCLGWPLIDNRLVGLSPEYFRPGQRFVLFLQRDGGGRVKYAGESATWVSEYVVFDGRFGALLDDDELRANVRKAVAARGGAKSPGKYDPFARRRHR